MIQETRKFVRYREKFEIEKFEIEKGYAVLLGKISRDQAIAQDREIFEIEGSRDRKSPLYLLTGLIVENSHVLALFCKLVVLILS